MESRFLIPLTLAFAAAVSAIALNLMYGLTFLGLVGLSLFLAVIAFDQHGKKHLILDGLELGKRNLRK